MREGSSPAAGCWAYMTGKGDTAMDFLPKSNVSVASKEPPFM